MLTFHAKYGTDKNGDMTGYMVSSPDKEMPHYFAPIASGSAVAHDICDHITYNPGNHPVIDELVAIGAVFYRTGDPILLATDVEYLLGDFYEQDIDVGIEDKKEQLEHERHTTHNMFHIKYTQPIEEDIEDEIIPILDNYANKGYYHPWLCKYRKHIQRHLLKALTKGYRMAEKVYGSHHHASSIYYEIKNYVDKHLPKKQSYFTMREIDENSTQFRFLVRRGHGIVTCQHKEPYEQRYW